MERLPDDEYAGKPSGVKDRPRCERCGRPIKVNLDDYERDELLCPSCASDARAARLRDPDFDGTV